LILIQPSTTFLKDIGAASTLESLIEVKTKGPI